VVFTERKTCVLDNLYGGHFALDHRPGGSFWTVRYAFAAGSDYNSGADEFCLPAHIFGVIVD